MWGLEGERTRSSTPNEFLPAQHPSVFLSDADRLIGRAEEFLKRGISAERDPRSNIPLTLKVCRLAFLLAETYDPRVHSLWNACAIHGDRKKMRERYARAYEGRSHRRERGSRQRNTRHEHGRKRDPGPD
jgi:hypothetical protein